MTEAIEAAVAIEQAKNQSLYFIDIAADDIDFMPQLAILDEVTDAPILIATSAYNEDEHHEALNNGADFYGQYCEVTEKNINAVMTVVNSYHRVKNHKASINIITCGRVLISLSRRTAYVNDMSVDLTRQEFDILHLLMINRGKILTYEEIFRQVWGEEYIDSSVNTLSSAIKRLKHKMRVEPETKDYIKNKHQIGYSFDPS